MSRRAIWQMVYERFDPERPAEEQALRADRPQSPAERIIAGLDRPFGDPRVLFTGTVGTGKTTELLRVTEARRDKEFVVFLDLERHFSEVVQDAPALQRISAWEVCFLAGVALIAQARERLGFVPPAEHLRDLERAWLALAGASETPAGAEVNVGNLASAMVGVAAKGAALVPGAGPVVSAAAAGLAGAMGAVKWTLPIGRSKRELPDQEPLVQSLLGSVNVLVGLVQQRSRRVLFVIDGLDRIRDIDRAKALFVDSQMISRLACPSIVCGPFALRHHPATAAVRGFSTVCVLVNEPVLLQADPAQPGPGVPFFCELFDKRIADLGASDLVPRDRLKRLAYRSGGRARDFVLFIRSLAEAAWQEDATVATDALVSKVLDDWRRQREMGLHRGHIQLLEDIAADPEHRLPAGPLAQELLSYGTLLPYPNESEWYYPHPLLTMHLVKVPGSRPSGSS